MPESDISKCKKRGVFLNILVFMKQVPDTTEIKIDPVTKTLIRAGVPSIVNPFDAFALELAVRAKEAVGGEITLVSMGPAQAKEALKECLAVGADKAYLVTDRKFGGSDTLATSYILSTAVKKLEAVTGAKYDLIFCGNQAIDGDTGQVGPEVAEHLGYGQVTYVTDLTVEEGAVLATRDTDEGHDVIRVSFPAVITVTKTNYPPRFASVRGKMFANRAVIEEMTFADVEDMIDPARIGLTGSATKVVKTFTPDLRGGGLVIQESDPDTAAKQLVDVLIGEKLI